MKDPKGTPLDLTERIRQRSEDNAIPLSEEEIKDIQAQFLAQVLHQLRTPLSVIKLYVEAIQDGMFEDNNAAFAKLDAKFQEFEHLMDTLLSKAKGPKH
ncbi:histidine kinase dimerization/phospho-acceptor domain-containing protein [Gallaecimonas kandeliae]|uniref:histidine kinase dimerization/phospho-acceptor domain-containing protein n=1 Tax=Gallaecimonas kandeliae TaxID=3029055 RepID=UPI00264A114C|nr:histidine kinase dimerization/phospho-acceptor domain-containing protein [Gallaecimonas kandeliae]WKE64565.1 histidine kinase dimerization/phospho-acceptor domain-containing protein [Gallaecimonas kandeliae]